MQWVRARLPFGRSYLEPGRQLGPWFYAPALTAVVAPCAPAPLACFARHARSATLSWLAPQVRFWFPGRPGVAQPSRRRRGWRAGCGEVQVPPRVELQGHASPARAPPPVSPRLQTGVTSCTVGMCLNSCKLPAQQLFSELGLPLRVSPNFETQECQWSFGEAAPPPDEDPTWPKGCVVGCTSREAMRELSGGGPAVRACE